MRAGVDALAYTATGRTGAEAVAVLGRMAELGEGTVAEHTALGHYLSTRGVREAVVVGEGAELDALADAARAEGVTVYRAADTDAAVAHLATVLHPGDVVLVKASYSDGLWRVADGLHDKETK